MRSLFKMKFRWILAFAFIFFAFVLVLHYYQPPPETDVSNQSNLNAATVNSSNPIKVEAVICLDINKYDEPLGVKSEFGNPDYVFCHAQFRDVPVSQQITFRWLFENKQMAKIDANANSGQDVIWSRFNFPEEKRGNWAVEISTKNGDLLSRVPFVVKNFSE